MGYGVTPSQYGEEELGYATKSLNIVPHLPKPNVNDVPEGIKDIIGTKGIVGYTTETQTNVNLGVIPDYISFKTGAAKDALTTRIGNIIPSTTGTIIEGGIGYEGPGYPVNKNQTSETLLHDFRQGTFTEPHHLAGTYAGQSSKIEYVPTHTFLPNDNPEGTYMWTGWENKPGSGKIGTVFKLEAGESEISGIYGAPGALGHFTKSMSAGMDEWQLFGIGLPKLKSPSLIRTEGENFEVIPEWV